MAASCPRSAACFIIPIPWVYRWFMHWFASQFALAADAERSEPIADALERDRSRLGIAYLRSRTEPSCATEATSVPSGLKIMPRVKPRPPCALGESCA